MTQIDSYTVYWRVTLLLVLQDLSFQKMNLTSDKYGKLYDLSKIQGCGHDHIRQEIRTVTQNGHYFIDYAFHMLNGAKYIGQPWCVPPQQCIL